MTKMELSLTSILLISVLIMFVAGLYSSVGHGGASGYMAVLSLFALAPAQMSATALVLNVLVAGLSLYSFYRAGHLSIKLAWPFIASSVPAAFLGGLIHVSQKAYFLLLAAFLLFAAFRLAFSDGSLSEEGLTRKVSLGISIPSGAAIGLLSGIVGVGGGILLSPLMLLMKWASTKQTAAVSALFIIANSLAGLGGRLAGGSLNIGIALPFVAGAFFGGLIGSYYGAKRFSTLLLRRILAVVLVIAAFKLVMASL
jgi:hypothetical protein